MARKKTFTDDDDALLSELGVETEVVKKSKYTAEEERVIAGFEEIQSFVSEHGRKPSHGESNDIFERLYAVRLDRIRSSNKWKELLQPIDSDGLLSSSDALDEDDEQTPLNDEDLL